MTNPSPSLTRILVVDDNPVTVESSCRVLIQAGYEVRKAFNGTDALRAVKEHHPDLILLDREMPGISGLDVCRQIKEDPALAGTFVVFASATRLEVEEQVRGLDAGADGYIVRPIGNEELRARVDAYVRIAKLNRQLESRTHELQEANQVLTDSRRAALSLMEDALRSNERLEQAKVALQESEIRYHQIVDTQEDAICRWRPDTTLTFANAQYLKLFGLSADSYRSRQWIDFIPESEREPLRARIRSLAENPVRVIYEHPVNLADGSVRHYHWTDSPILDAEGTCVEFQSVGRDITDLRESEAQAAKRLSAIEHSPASIVITDRNGTIEYVNSRFTLVSGYTAEEALGQNPRVLKSGDMPLEAYRAMWKDLAAGKDWQGEFHNRRKDGTLFWELASISPIRNPQGEITHYVAVKEDITARKAAEARLHMFSQRAQFMLELSALAATVSETAFMQRATECMEDLTGSKVSFIHFINDDQATIELVTWSRRTLESYCQAGFDRHYPIAKAGIWAEAFRQRKPVVINDYAQAPNRRGLPEGHAALTRLISLPVMEGDRVRMLVGVGNKESPYNQTDVETIQLLANEAWRIVRQKRSDEALRMSEELLEETGQAGGVGGWELDLLTNALRWTRQTRRIHEVPDDYVPVLETGISFYDPEGRPELVKAINEAMTAGKPWDLELPFTTAKGRKLWVRAMGQARFENGKAVKLLGAFHDVTARRLAEAERAALNTQLAQAQKMESIGLLAGGIAHEFNNKLQTILGFTELASMASGADSPLAKDLLEIQKAARHSAELTQQLLAYASRQMVTPRQLNLNDTLKSMLRMVQQLLGESMNLKWYPGSDLWPINMDPNQIDQILTNLAVNARDAMKGQGLLTISTQNVTVGAKDSVKPPDQPEGDYVRLAVTDTGSGMSAETLSRIFEPFFTTKPQGKGTGLGLPTVYGIVRQNGGFLHVESQLGQGSTFSVYLPRDFTPARTADRPADGIVAGGCETVLLVEDEQAILRMAKTALEQLGYMVLVAAQAQEAISLVERHAGSLDLLVTDVVMPGLNGQQLYRILRARRPALKVLYISGHTAGVLDERGVVTDGTHFLAKPFALHALAEKVRTVLDEAPTGPSDAGTA